MHLIGMAYRVHMMWAEERKQECGFVALFISVADPALFQVYY